MAFQHLERNLKRSGDTDLAKIAIGLRDAWRQRHLGQKDIPLPTVARTAVETEAPEIQRFSTEAREALEARGFVVYELTGQSIKSLRDQRHPFWSTWHKDYPQFEALPSRKSEVAIDPSKLFIPRSNNKTLAEQLEAVRKFSDGLNIPGVEAVLGEAADYTELAFTHLDKTGKRLFGSDYGFNYTRTQTRVEGLVASVGDLYADHGLDVDHWYPSNRHGDLFAAPLVVPVFGTK